MTNEKKYYFSLQNQERKHRTYVYVLIVTEVLEDWEDSVNIGKALHLFACRSGDHTDKVLRQSHDVCSFSFPSQALAIMQLGDFIIREILTTALFLPL